MSSSLCDYEEGCMMGWDCYIVVQMSRITIRNAAFRESHYKVNVRLPVHTDLVGRVLEAFII